MSRLLRVLAVVVVAIALVGALVVFLGSRDSGGVAPASGPGTLEPDHGARVLAPGASSPPPSPADDPPTSGNFHRAPIARDGVELSDDQILNALHQGNVVIAYDAASPPAALVALQRTAAGAYDPSLAAAGQAVILARRPGLDGVVALAWRRRLRAASASDPQLGAFTDAWLGQGPG